MQTFIFLVKCYHSCTIRRYAEYTVYMRIQVEWQVYTTIAEWPVESLSFFYSIYTLWVKLPALRGCIGGEVPLDIVAKMSVSPRFRGASGETAEKQNSGAKRWRWEMLIPVVHFSPNYCWIFYPFLDYYTDDIILWTTLLILRVKMTA